MQKVLRGSLLSMGQVYAAESVVCSIIMYIGITIFSPMLSIALFTGSLLASVCGKLHRLLHRLYNLINSGITQLLDLRKTTRQSIPVSGVIILH
jgi:hypothetical protein